MTFTQFGKTLTLAGALAVGGLGTFNHAAAAQPDTQSASVVTTASQPTQVTTPASTETNKQAADKKLNLSPIFIQLSDAMGAVKAGDTAHAQSIMRQVQSEFDTLNTTSSQLGQTAAQAIAAAQQNPTSDNLSAVSSALYAFEKEQNPVDYSAKRKAFAAKIVPAYEQFAQVVNSGEQDATKLRAAYNQLYNTWLAHERVVRNTSMGHYGKIETALALIRVSIESDPVNHTQIQTQLANLKQNLDSYNAGETTETTVPQGATLDSGIQLLRDGLAAYQSGDHATGQTKLGEFIALWPSIEGDVSTRNPALYSRVESQVPIIMANGQKPEQQANLQTLISELAQINPAAQYTAIDSMLILLREGLEALLVVVALLSALTAANQPRGKKWVYGGVVTGLLASIAAALALQQLFPAATSGANREMFEGYVGIVAVVMMIIIGAWLHSKASVKSWNRYIQRHMGAALTAGSFTSLFALSFLSVFREGAETILFYVGVLPNITMQNFWLGIGMALILLAVVAFVLLKTSVRLPIPKLFQALTWVIYFLGFKILGVSLHALQLTQHLGMTHVNLPAIEWLGFYPTVQTIIAQIAYIVAIVVLQVYMRRADKPVPHVV